MGYAVKLQNSSETKPLVYAGFHAMYNGSNYTYTQLSNKYNYFLIAALMCSETSATPHMSAYTINKKYNLLNIANFGSAYASAWMSGNYLYVRGNHSSFRTEFSLYRDPD